jgi:hypothetical protein
VAEQGGAEKDGDDQERLQRHRESEACGDERRGVLCRPRQRRGHGRCLRHGVGPFSQAWHVEVAVDGTEQDEEQEEDDLGDDDPAVG